ncbi:unnamed protein product [Ceutorhynchus assimilis]|uniref:Regulatory protein zeste n=1 Tax=Ceutorhynchus assimilis TaxID=467358 RepID=A0A9N9MJ09_9CUCU|nr:unnamed protein product [Ceutorhynchus assimilis]
MEKKTISPQQKIVLIEFMEQNPVMVTQKQSNQFTNADISKLWQTVTLTLNSIPGATKTWKEWRKTWSDIKSRTKKRVHENRKEALKTGGGPNISEGVNTEDEKVLEIIGGDLLIEGIDVPEAGIPIVWKKQDYLLQKAVTTSVQSEEQEELIGKPQAAQKKEIDITDEEPERTKAVPKQRPQSIKAVRPPVTPISRGRTHKQNRAALELVQVEDEGNKIREEYYNKKLKLMEQTSQENLDIKQEELKLKKEENYLKQKEINILEEISQSIRSFLNKISE